MERPEIESHIPHEQTYFPGTEPPPEDPERTKALDEVVYAWLEGKTEQRKAADTTKMRHSTMIARLVEAGAARYPYKDYAGRKRYVVVDTTPKAKTSSGPRPKKSGKPKRSKRWADDADKDPNEKAAERAQKRLDEDANRVESRRVPRASVDADVDPFAATRKGLIDEAEDRASRSMDEATPTRPKAKKRKAKR